MDDSSKIPQSPSGEPNTAPVPFGSNPQPAAPDASQPAAERLDAAVQVPADAAASAQAPADSAAPGWNPAPEPAPNAAWTPVSGDPGAASAPPTGRAPYTPGQQQFAAQQPYAAQQPTTPPPGSVPPGQPGGYPQSMPPYGYQPPKQTSGKAVGALVCGILAILFCWTIVPSIVLGVVAIVLAGKVVKETGKDGKTTGAKVCGIVGIAFSVLTLAAALALGAFVGWAINRAEPYDYSQSGSAAITGPSSSSGSSESADRSQGGADAGSLTADEQAVASLAQAEFDKLAAQDAAMVQEMARELDDEMRDMTEDIAGPRGVSLTDAGIDPTTVAAWMLEGMTYSVDDVYVYSNGREADVFATVTMRDQRSVGSLFQQKFSEATVGVNMVDVEQVKTAVNAAMVQTMAEYNELVPVSYSFEVENRGGSWVADDKWYDDLVEDVFF